MFGRLLTNANAVLLKGVKSARVMVWIVHVSRGLWTRVRPLPITLAALVSFGGVGVERLIWSGACSKLSAGQ